MFIFYMVFMSNIILTSRYVTHSSMFVTKEFVDGIEFSHTVKSEQGKLEEKFLIDGEPVLKDEYYKRLEESQLKELRKDREKTDRRVRAKIAFVDQAQAIVLEKLALRYVKEIEEILDQLSNGSLRPYYRFTDNGVQSSSHLSEMKHYIRNIGSEIKDCCEEHDIQSLQEIVDKIEFWPEILEGFYKDSVQNAIRQSDDTAALRELLSMVSCEAV